MHSSVMQAVVPDAVLAVCKTLRDAGYAAWIVGGAVRDLVLGIVPSDWDVASDALPERVLELFDKTVATGLQHGTVTAVVGRGAARQTVEITTFRGEGAYSDSRRPDQVHFGVPLDEDLKRRDFVINAMAFDPVAEELYDPFGGVADIEARRLRAVGVAAERFNEDGLRVLRAVRFVSTLDLELDPDTESGIRGALGALSKVAPERVRVELLKLLSGRAPSRALEIAERNGILGVILPELSSVPVHAAIERVKWAGGDAIVALGALLAGLEVDRLEALLRRLTMSNEERHRIVGMLAAYDLESAQFSSDMQWRKLLSRVGRRHAADFLQILEAEASRRGDEQHLAAIARGKAILHSGVPLEVGDLAIDGKRLMAETSARGRSVGDVLRALLDAVLEEPERNQTEALVAMAQQLVNEAEESP